MSSGGQGHRSSHNIARKNTLLKAHHLMLSVNWALPESQRDSIKCDEEPINTTDLWRIVMQPQNPATAAGSHRTHAGDTRLDQGKQMELREHISSPLGLQCGFLSLRVLLVPKQVLSYAFMYFSRMYLYLGQDELLSRKRKVGCSIQCVFTTEAGFPSVAATR